MKYDDDTPEQDAAWEKRESFARLIANTQATTIEGAAAQFEWFDRDICVDEVRGNMGDDFANCIDVIQAGLNGLGTRA